MTGMARSSQPLSRLLDVERSRDMRKYLTTFAAMGLGLLAWTATGCDQNDNQTAGKKTNNAVDRAGDTGGNAVDRANTNMRNAAEKTGNAADKTGDAMDRAADKTG